MRKISTVIALVLTMILLLCACSGGTEDPQGQVNPGEKADNTTNSGQITAAEPESTPETQSESTLSLGRIQGGTYTNKYIGMECQLDESWEFYSAEELQQLPAQISELFEGSELEEALANMEHITDIQAENVDNMTGFNILYRKMPMQERLWYATKTDEDVINELFENKELLIDSYAQAGIVLEEMSSKEVTFLGEQRLAFHMVGKIGDINYYVLQIYENNLGSYAVTMTFNSFVEDKTMQVMELFYKA